MSKSNRPACNRLWLFIHSFLLLTIIVGCSPSHEQKSSQSGQTSALNHPKWARKANIYEVNIRQYTPEGTFKAFQKKLSRLQKMGVKILWLMPINPIGQKNRKGPLGSYYSIKDYRAVNKNFGTMEDFKALVKKAHKLGMKVILDWVANHTAWDHVWAKNHPEWYNKDSTGHFMPPVKDWSDVIDLNYDNAKMRQAMIDAMKFWLKKTNIDGFRCDYAKGVPDNFWKRVISQLEKIKPIFMLAEAEDPRFYKDGFDMTYGWELYHLMKKIHQGDKPFSSLTAYMSREDSAYPADAYRMYFTTNHDENSWSGTDVEMYGKDFQNFAVLSATIGGMPLIYSGQEAGLDKRLAFFRKDTISWDHEQYADFYSKLLHLKSKNVALWNGKAGGDFKVLPTEPSQKIYAYQRKKDAHQVLVVLNFGDKNQDVRLKEVETNTYTDIFSEKKVSIDSSISVKSHHYRVLAK